MSEDQSTGQNTAEGAGNNTGQGEGQGSGIPATGTTAAGGTTTTATTNQGGDKLFSQADLDRIVKERLADEQKRAERKIAEERKKAEEAKLKEQGEYSTLAEQYKARVAELEQELSAKERAALCLRIATEEKLPADLASRLVGDDENAIREDARRLVKFLAPPKAPDAEGGSRGNGSGTSVFDQIRQQAIAERKAKQEQQGRPIEEVLGLTPPPATR